MSPWKQVAMQEARNQKNLLEQTKADMTLTRNTHQEETSRLQQDIQILKVGKVAHHLQNSVE